MSRRKRGGARVLISTAVPHQHQTRTNGLQEHCMQAAQKRSLQRASTPPAGHSPTFFSIFPSAQDVEHDIACLPIRRAKLAARGPGFFGREARGLQIAEGKLHPNRNEESVLTKGSREQFRRAEPTTGA